MAMSSGSTVGADLGKLILRLALGVMFMLHGIAKIVSGPAGIVAMVQQAGLPGSVGYLVYVGELLAPLLVILGLWTRPAAVVIAMILMIVASNPLANFVSAHPTVKMLALAFLLLIGVVLIADGLGFHVPKGYIYFALAFSVAVETLNHFVRRRRKRLLGA